MKKLVTNLAQICITAGEVFSPVKILVMSLAGSTNSSRYIEKKSESL